MSMPLCCARISGLSWEGEFPFAKRTNLIAGGNATGKACQTEKSTLKGSDSISRLQREREL